MPDHAVAHIRQAWAIFRRRRRLVLGITALGTAAAVAVIAQLEPRYRAEVLVLLEPRRPQIVTTEEVLSAPDVAGNFGLASSEVQVLQSDELSRRVIERLNLLELEEFRPEARSGPLAETRRRLGQLAAAGAAWWQQALAEAGLAQAAPAPGEEPEPASRPMVHAIRAYNKGLSVFNAEPSYAIKIAFVAGDPVLAARIANEHASVYLADQMQAKFDASERAKAWLAEQLGQLRVDLEEAEAAVQGYRKERRLLALNGNSVIAQQLSELNSQLVLASADLASEEAELHQLQLARNQANGLAAIAAVLDAELIQNLREREADLVREQGRLANEFGARHPAMINVNEEIAELRAKIDLEVEKIFESRANALAAARGRVASLQAEIDRLEIRLTAAYDAELGLRELEREAAAQREVFQQFLQRYKEVIAQTGLQSPDARIVSAAMPPNDPFFPRSLLFTLLAGVASGVGGIGLAVLLERLERGIRSSREFEALFRSPCLGVLPRVRRRLAPPRPHDLVIKRPASPFAEAVRELRGALTSDTHLPASRCRVLTVSSSLPGEGKSVLAIAIARSLSIAGQRVLLIDCDRYKPQLARLLGADLRRPGLGAVVAGAATVPDALQRDRLSPLHYIPVETSAGGEAGFVHGEQLRELLMPLRRDYDVILLDTPPLTGVSDALVLGPATDGVIFVARWRTTPKAIVAGALQRLHLRGARIIGGVLTCADFERPEVFSEADFEHYYARSTYCRRRPGLVQAATRPLLVQSSRAFTGSGAPGSTAPPSAALEEHADDRRPGNPPAGR